MRIYVCGGAYSAAYNEAKEEGHRERVGVVMLYFWNLRTLEVTMKSMPEGVTAAPNRCQITARVLREGQEPSVPEKREATLEILESRDIRGPNFAHAGDRVEAFTFEAPPAWTEGTVIRAEAEYLGDARRGRFQLYGPEVVDSD
jgi:hypothetical protein